jgi:hypothetical protein
MLPNGAAFSPTDTVPVLLNTIDPTTGEAAAWTSGAIRLMRLRGDPETTTNWTEITDDVGYDLELDWDPSATPRTGLHAGWVDLDGLTSAAQAGDLYAVVGSAGTVDSKNLINLALAHWWVLSDTLTAGQIAAILAQLATFFGVVTGAVATDGGNSATGFEVDVDVGSDVRVGMLRLTSGALAGEGRLVSWTGTTVTVESQTSMSTALKEFSATPADGVTFAFSPF